MGFFTSVGSDLIDGVDLNWSNFGFFFGESPSKSTFNERFGGVNTSEDLELLEDMSFCGMADMTRMEMWWRGCVTVNELNLYELIYKTIYSLHQIGSIIDWFIGTVQMETDTTENGVETPSRVRRTRNIPLRYRDNEIDLDMGSNSRSTRRRITDDFEGAAADSMLNLRMNSKRL